MISHWFRHDLSYGQNESEIKITGYFFWRADPGRIANVTEHDGVPLKKCTNYRTIGRFYLSTPIYYIAGATRFSTANILHVGMRIKDLPRRIIISLHRFGANPFPLPMNFLLVDTGRSK